VNSVKLFTIFITISITVLDIVWKCYGQIVNGTALLLCKCCVCVCVRHILCHRILVIHYSSELCAHARVKIRCVRVSWVHVLCIYDPWSYSL
jgi:hypothetical protein